MPKQFKTYDRFDGGLNTKDHVRSIRDTELSIASNVVIDEFGMIKSCGKAADNDTNYTDPSVDATVAGYGLFQATFDYNAGGTNTPTVRTFLADTDDDSDTQIDIFDAGGSWVNRGTGGNIDLGSTASGAVIYDLADGVVRICDTNFGAGNAVKWYGYITRKLWIDGDGSQLNVSGGSAQNVTGWKTASAPPLAPFAGTAGTGIVAPVLTVARGLEFESAGVDHLNIGIGGTTYTSTFDVQFDAGLYVAINEDGSEVQGIASRNDNTTLVLDSTESWGVGSSVTGQIAPDAGLGFNLEVVVTGTGTFTAATYEFAQTFIYDGNQESLPTVMTGTIVVAASKYLGCTVIASHGYADRVTGGRIYCRDSTQKGEWQFLIDISLTNGCRTTLDSDYTGWETTYDQAAYLDCGVNIAENNVDTYATINGYPSDLSTLSVGAAGEGYKTSVVANRRKFIAYVKSVNDSGQTEVKSDRLMYSEINRFDTFPPINFIDIGTNDGESFIKLESFADRLLAFKERTLYVVNIGSGSDTQWFLESEHKNLGVEFNAAVVKTSAGVCWVNKNGLYLYDGSKITNLQTKILESDWKDFVNSDTMIGYEPVNKHLCVVRDANNEASDNGDAYVCNLNNGAFTFIEDLFADSNKSNIITDAYNKMTAVTGLTEIVSYDGEPDAGTTLTIALKDDDFGLPNIVKKIYGVIIEYSSSAAGIVVYSYTDDKGVAQGTATIGTLPSTSGDMDINRFNFMNSGFPEPKLASSFKIFISASGSSIYNINNIAVEYRPMSNKRVAYTRGS